MFDQATKRQTASASLHLAIFPDRASVAVRICRRAYQAIAVQGSAPGRGAASARGIINNALASTTAAKRLRFVCHINSKSLELN